MLAAFFGRPFRGSTQAGQARAIGPHVTLPAPLDGLRGLRLAIYDEALAAGPLGIGRDTLLVTVEPDAKRLGITDSWPDFEWLVVNRFLVWMPDGLLRARNRNDVTLAITPALAPLPRTPEEQHWFEKDQRAALEPKTRKDVQTTFF